MDVSGQPGAREGGASTNGTRAGGDAEDSPDGGLDGGGPHAGGAGRRAPRG